MPFGPERGYRQARTRHTWAALSDRIGGKPVFIFGGFGSALLIRPYIRAISKAKILTIFALGGFAPSISAAIMQDNQDGWMTVAAFVTLAAAIAAISAATARETCRVPMEGLGRKEMDLPEHIDNKSPVEKPAAAGGS